MKKLILKTALFTLLGVTGTLAVLFGVFALFFPKNIASVADQMGNYGVSVFYYEKAYEKSGSTVDLYDLVVNLDENVDYSKTYQYSKELLEKGDFSTIEKGGTPTVREEISAKYAISAFLSNQPDVAIAFCKEYVLENGYGAYNPFTVSLSAVLTKMPKETAEKVFTALGEIAGSTEIDENTRINEDLALLEVYLNK